MTPFTGALLTAGKARVAPLCLHNKQCATWPAVKSARPAVARIGPPGVQRDSRGGACPMRCIAQGVPLDAAPSRATRYAS